MSYAKKRRRERDRPKGGPDASYNPNKRVLLCYDSDDGEDGEDGKGEALRLSQPEFVNHAQATNTGDAGYEPVPYPEDEDKPCIVEDAKPTEGAAELGQTNLGPGGEAGMADKAGRTELQEKGDSLWTRGVTRDVDTGQWPALGAPSYEYDLEDEDDHDHDSETEEAMAYLRGVRSERQNLPAFFTAPAMTELEELYDSGMGDNRGYLSEGTYIARPVIGAVMPDSERTYITPQEAYTRHLKERFLKQRQQLHVEPNAPSLAALTERHPVAFDGGDEACCRWRKLLTETVPLPAQIRSIDQDSVYGLLGLIQRFHLRRSTEISQVLSVWIWSLLARLDDVGTMNNDEAYMVREFAKRAVLVQVSFDDPAAAQQLECLGVDQEVSSTSQDDEKATIEDMSTKKVLESGQVDPSARDATLITLDIIIIIVGDVFGQRDLLDFRREWTAQEEEAK